MSDRSGLKMKCVYWLAARLPSCEAISRLISEQNERSITMRERIQKRLHFAICKWCARYERQLQLMRSMARDASANSDAAGSSGPGLSDDARERLRRAIAGRR